MSAKRRVSAVIFDLDGTLADTFPMIMGAFNAAVSPHTGKTYSDTEIISRFGIPDPAMLRRELPQAAWEEAVEVYHRHYEREHGKVKKFAGVEEMLAQLKQRGIKMGLMTGKGRRSADITVRLLGWAKLFDAVVTGEDVKEQKPAPEGVLLAAKMMGVSPTDCAFIGDSPADVGAGQNAGMVTVVAGWHPVYLEEVRKMGPDVWAEKPSDVVALVS
jgi:2-phosphoglycolate phosphatase